MRSTSNSKTMHTIWTEPNYEPRGVLTGVFGPPVLSAYDIAKARGPRFTALHNQQTNCLVFRTADTACVW